MGENKNKFVVLWLMMGVSFWGVGEIIFQTIPEFDPSLFFSSNRAMVLGAYILTTLSIWIWGWWRYIIKEREFTFVQIFPKVQILRYVLIMGALVMPAFLLLFKIPFLYPPFGYLSRVSIFFAFVIIATFIYEPTDNLTAMGKRFLLFTVIASVVFGASRVFNQVSNYPFSIGWSEGNRIWDYSLMFGSDRYIFPSDKAVFSYTDTGRQFLWGISFLIPGLDILGFRFWDAIVKTLPGFVLGAALAWQNRKEVGWKGVLFFGLWSFTFILQGPIYSTLIILAIVTVYGVWIKNLFLGGLLVATASYFATYSRFTWVFAPGLWAVMLAILIVNQPSFKSEDRSKLLRPIVLGIAGYLGGQIFRQLSYFEIALLIGSIWIFSFLIVPFALVQIRNFKLSSWVVKVSHAVAIMAVVGIGLMASLLNRGRENLQQIDMVVFTLLILAVLGLILVKKSAGAIGSQFKFLFLAMLYGVTGYFGGLILLQVNVISKYLHGFKVAFPLKTIYSFDMEFLNQSFLWDRLLPNPTYAPGIALGLLWAVGPFVVFLSWMRLREFWKPNGLQIAAVAFAAVSFFVVGVVASVKIGGGGDLHNMDMFLVLVLILAAVVFPSVWQMIQRTDAKFRAVYPGVLLLVLMPSLYIVSGGAPLVLPDREIVESVLGKVQNEVQLAKIKGEVLFMDQRQLLTFGYVNQVDLVDDYEKKLLIDRAFSKNMDYFENFYSDLANHRFSMIVTERIFPYRTGREGSPFSEENDTWVLWVSNPLLKYYEPIFISNDLNISLLVPIQD